MLDIQYVMETYWTNFFVIYSEYPWISTITLWYIYIYTSWIRIKTYWTSYSDLVFLWKEWRTCGELVVLVWKEQRWKNDETWCFFYFSQEWWFKPNTMGNQPAWVDQWQWHQRGVRSRFFAHPRNIRHVNSFLKPAKAVVNNSSIFEMTIFRLYIIIYITYIYNYIYNIIYIYI